MNSNPEYPGNIGNQEFMNRILALEQRVARLEAESKHYAASSATDKMGIDEQVINVPSDEQLESSIGEYGLAWLGNIVLFFGVTFFVQYMQVNGYKFISEVLGFSVVGGIFFLAYYLRNSNPYMAKVFNLNAYLLVFYVTLKLYFFTPNPILPNKIIGLGLLLIVVAALMFLSIRKRSTVITGLALILMTVTAILSDSTHILFSLLTIVSIASIILLYRFGWIRIVFLTIFLVYFSILLWMFGNPIISHQMQLIASHQSGYIYLFLVAAIFSLSL